MACESGGIAKSLLLVILLLSCFAALRPSIKASGSSTVRSGGILEEPAYTLALDWALPMEDPGSTGIELCPTHLAFDAAGRLVVHSTCNVVGHGSSSRRLGGALAVVMPDGRMLEYQPLNPDEQTAAAHSFVLDPVRRRIYYARSPAPDILTRSLAGPGVVQSAWKVLGGRPEQLAVGPGGTIAAFTVAGIARYGPEAQRRSPWRAEIGGGDTATPGTFVLSSTGDVYLVDETLGGGVHKYSYDGEHWADWALDEHFDLTGPIAVYPGNDTFYVLDGDGVTQELQVRVFTANGATNSLLPVSPDLLPSPRPLLGVSNNGSYALYGRTPDGWETMFFHAPDGSLLGRVLMRRAERFTYMQQSIDAGRDGEVLVARTRPRLALIYDASGQERLRWQPPITTTDTALAPGDDLLLLSGSMLTSQARVARHRPDGTLVWSVELDRPTMRGIAADDRFVFVAAPYDGSVEVLAFDTGDRLGRLSYDDGFRPADVDIGPDGRLYALDPWLGEVEVWDVTTWAVAPLARRYVGTPGEVQRFAAGPGGRIARLRRGGAFSVVDQSGAELWAVSADPPDPPPGTFSDVAYDPNGRLIALAAHGDGVHPDHVYSFVPTGASETPIIVPSVTPNPTPQPASGGLCNVSGTKDALPKEIVLGDEVEVTLTLQGQCPDGEDRPADVVLCVDQSGSMGGEKELAAGAAVAAFVEGIDLTMHRVGVVTFSGAASVYQPLTDSEATLRALPDSFGAEGGTDIAGALRVADKHLSTTARVEARAVIVLLSDGANNAGHEPALQAAEAARSRGVILHTVAIGSDADVELLMLIAGESSRFHFAAGLDELADIYRQIAGRLSQGGRNVVLDDTLGDDVLLVAGSVSPRPWSPAGAQMRWRTDHLPPDPISITYRVIPQRTGLVPTNREAWFDYGDSDGSRRRYLYPVPMVRVIAPSATPSPTSSPTPRPTATRLPRPIYLPVALHEECTPAQQRIDVALVIDASTSMRKETREGRTKLAAAVEAVDLFLGELNLPRDQAAVVQFNGGVELLQELTGDRGALVDALGRIQVKRQTRIDLGIQVAREELKSSRRRSGNQAVMIVLTDGKANPVGPDAAVREAEAAKADKITIFTIGLGEDLNLHALEAMASKPRYFYRAPDGEDLKEIYAAIAIEIPCPAEDFWGRR